MNETTPVQVADQFDETLEQQRSLGGFGVASLAISALRTWRFSVSFHTDTLHRQVSADLC
jgi:hypothetical protein